MSAYVSIRPHTGERERERERARERESERKRAREREREKESERESEREREREREREHARECICSVSLHPNTPSSVRSCAAREHMFVRASPVCRTGRHYNIYTHTHIYIKRGRERKR
jgi:hypothetical protein